MRLKHSVTALLFLLLPAKTFFPGQDNKIDALLNKMEKKYNTIEALSCRYEQSEKISQLTEIIHLTGKLYFRKPHFVMMEMRGAENLNLYVNGENIWIEDLDLAEVETIDFAQMNTNQRLARFLPPFFLNSVAELKELFSITLLPATNGRDRLEFSPRSAAGFQFRSFQIEVDSLGRIPWLKVVYDAENFKEIRFKDWKKIPKTSKYFFQYREKKRT